MDRFPFTSGQIAEACGINQAHLQNVLRRMVLDLESEPKRAWRKFSVLDALLVALAVEVQKQGLSFGAAGAVANAVMLVHRRVGRVDVVAVQTSDAGAPSWDEQERTGVILGSDSRTVYHGEWGGLAAALTIHGGAYVVPFASFYDTYAQRLMLAREGNPAGDAE